MFSRASITKMIEPQPARTEPVQWTKVIDHTRCIGCHACTTACKSENVVPIGVTRTYVKHVDVGVFPQVRRAHQVTRCNQCAHAPCVAACPTSAMHTRPDGIVDFDKSICIGCKACMAACPYDAIFINPEDHSAEKCNFCAHRIDVGLEPACVTVCPTQAILVGDLEDPRSLVAQIAHREPVAVRRPEKGTQPKLFYKGAHQATLDPLAARRPDGGLFLWGEQAEAHDQVVSGHPRQADSRRNPLSFLRECGPPRRDVATADRCGPAVALWNLAVTEWRLARNQPPGEYYTVEGHRMYLRCTGAGSPTIVIESGLSSDSFGWYGVQHSLAKTTRVRA